MDRENYLETLATCLQGLPNDEIEDILSDYKEHFHIGLSKGKSEEEISKELGKPEDIAKNYISSSNKNSEKHYSENLKTTNEMGRKILLLLLLGFFNLVVVLGPYLAIIGILIAIYGIGAGFIFGGIGLLFGLPLSFIRPIPTPHFLTSLGFGVGLISLGVLAIILAIYLSKIIYRLTIKYIGWNIDIING